MVAHFLLLDLWILALGSQFIVRLACMTCSCSFVENHGNVVTTATTTTTSGAANTKV